MRHAWQTHLCVRVCVCVCVCVGAPLLQAEEVLHVTREAALSAAALANAQKTDAVARR